MMTNLNLLPFEPQVRVRLPARSRLYSLKPVISEEGRESFTGYLKRLANAHCVSPIDLINTEFRSVADDRALAFINRPSLVRESAHRLNSYGEFSNTFTSMAQKLTARDDIKSCTLAPWQGILSPNSAGTTKRNLAWCPQCYYEQLESLGFNYEKLIWNIKDVSVCHIHRRPLETKCPFCNMTQPTLSSAIKIGHCSRCCTWLGETVDRKRKQDHLFEGDLAYAKQVDALIKTGRELSAPPAKEDFIQSLSHFAVKYGRRKASTMSGRVLKVPSATFQNWRLGKDLPQVDMFLYICGQLGVSPIDFINKNTPKEWHPNLWIRTPDYLRKSTTMQEKYDRTKDFLDKSNAAYQSNAISLRELHEGLRKDESYFRKHFPEQVSQITGKHLDQLQRSAMEMETRFQEKLENAITLLNQQKNFPSIRAVSILINDKSWHRNRKHRAIYEELMIRMGLREKTKFVELPSANPKLVIISAD